MSADTAQELVFSPASWQDLPFIQETARRMRLDAEDLKPEQLLTLRRNGRVVAFGGTRSDQQTMELTCVAVVEEERGRGLGELMVRELIKRLPQDEVYIATDVPEYFEKLGFLRTRILPPEIEGKLTRARSGQRPGSVGMIYDRVIERFPTLADVYRAKHVIERYLPRTPLLRNLYFSNRLDCDAYLKLENLLPIGAFKVRGGVYLAAALGEGERARGIVGASTGNHGQSLAYGARMMGVRCVIAMPRESNPMKVEAMRALGAEIEFQGADFEEARSWAEGYAAREGMRYIHHINTPELVAGVATMSLEIIEDLPDVDVIITPVGGGSGAVGHCLVAKAFRRDVAVIGVQAAGAPAAYLSWRDRCLQRATIETAAEGLATGRAYYAPVKTFIERLDDFLLVSEEEISRAIVMLARAAHQVVEHSGATTAAAALKLGERLRGKKVAIVISGGNLPLEDMREVLEAETAG